MKKRIARLYALALTIALLTGAIPVQAATQEVQGNSSQTKNVPVTASITSVYSVSLPASISLVYGFETDDEENPVEGYWFRLRYGVTGKVTSAESVYVEAVFPCTLTDAETGAELEISELSKNRCKEEWGYDEVGSCSYNGSSLSNCEYAYCCANGHVIGVRAAEVTNGNFEGNLTFRFGINK